MSKLPMPPRPSETPKTESKSSWLDLASMALPLAASTLATALLVRLVMNDLRWAIPIAGVSLLAVAFLYLQHTRQRALMLGQGELVATWAPLLEKAACSEALQPIAVASSYAANGWTEAARDALRRDVRGVDDGAKEARLVVQIMLEAFDGDRALAIREADQLCALEPPAAGPLVRHRIVAFRSGVAALARAFARTARVGDPDLLAAAAKAAPLFRWPFAYAAAVDAIDEGRVFRARALIQHAPQWSRHSVFAEFHRELAEEIARGERLRAETARGDKKARD